MLSRRTVLGGIGSTLMGGIAGSVSAATDPLDFNTFAKLQRASRHMSTRIVRAGQTWERMFPGHVHIAKVVNRQNYVLKPGQVVVVPPRRASLSSLNPMPLQGYGQFRKVLVFSPVKYAWGLYEQGRLVRWGPAIGGGNWCADVQRSCRSTSGTYVVTEVAGPNRRSWSYPQELAAEGKGALMPYFMRYTSWGEGFHARYMNGSHITHGCVGLFYDDAKWLNLEHARRGRLAVVIERYA